MRFVYNDKKTAQAAAHLIARGGGSMNYMVLIKLLYLADRRSLLETGAPITGDCFVAMPHGPVLSQTLDQINMGSLLGGLTPWYEYVTEPKDYVVSVLKTETDELSANELDILNETFERFGRMNKWALRDYTHTLPEWSDPHGSSILIDPVSILRDAGKSDAEISALISEAESALFIDSLSRLIR